MNKKRFKYLIVLKAIKFKIKLFHYIALVDQFIPAYSKGIQMSDSLNLKYNAEVEIPGGVAAVNNDTNDGSPSLVTMKNLSNSNNARVSVTLGNDAKVYTISPKETVTYPENGVPANFEGLVLSVSNNSQPGTNAVLNTLLTANG